MDLESNIRSEISQRNTHITYMRTLQYGTNEPIYETEIDSQTQKTNTVTKREREAGLRASIWSLEVTRTHRYGGASGEDRG